jgi:hypothetical protein
MEHRLSPDHILFADDGTTPLKLEDLPTLMKIHRTAKMVGNYDASRAFLYTEKIVGGVFASLGFVRDKNYPDNRFYVPNTAIKGDIRNLTVQPVQRIMAILSKPMSSKDYMHLVYLAKGFNLNIPPISTLIKGNNISAGKVMDAINFAEEHDSHSD